MSHDRLASADRVLIPAPRQAYSTSETGTGEIAFGNLVNGGYSSAKVRSPKMTLLH